MSFNKDKVISQKGLELIMKEEGLYLKAYKCPAGVWTIGYGTTWYANGDKVKEGDTCTKEQAIEYLHFYVEKVSGRVIKEVVKNVQLTQGMYDSLCSLIYNIGEGAFKNSTLLKRLNEGDFTRAAEQFLVWNKIKGITSKGLTKRREREFNLFLTRN